MALDVDAAALLVYRAAWTKDMGAARVTREAAMAKLFATDRAQDVIDRAVQLHGGDGVRRGPIVESLYREIRALRIYEGASDVQKSSSHARRWDERSKGGESMSNELEKGITPNGKGFAGVTWNILGQTYYPKAVCESAFAFETDSAPGQFSRFTSTRARTSSSWCRRASSISSSTASGRRRAPATWCACRAASRTAISTNPTSRRRRVRAAAAGAGKAGGAGRAGGAGGPEAERRHKIEAAAAIARLDKDLSDFPHGYDTVVGERGITLLGGRKAADGPSRARSSSIRVADLDDSLSAVDTYTEEEILMRLKGVMRQRTSIIVSPPYLHRSRRRPILSL